MESEPAAIDATTQAEIVQRLAEKLKTKYVFPEIAEQVCDSLQAHLLAGDYAEITEGEFFAYILTAHLQEVSQDEHLWVRWHATPLPEREEQLSHDQTWLDKQRLKAEMDNYGLHKVERLPGNVGYLDIHRFERAEWGGETATAAMNFLAHTKALIIDLRQCMGGDPDMVALISSYLFGEEPVHLNSIYWRDEDITQQYWTSAYVPGRRFGDKPVYVLTSKTTFSAGEEFAYNLKTRQRATLVGETTAGGAHPGGPHRLHPHFEAFIPVGRAINPITNQNWEGVGVIPDISVSQEQAFDAAYSLALQDVVADLGEAAAETDKLLLEEAQAALQATEAGKESSGKSAN